ncbi:MAG: polyhydroxyalkanoate synthesis repressor PhaR [Thiobacillus sp.]|nr:polyhydroxyalkanoate synthesis repressor PhaR [Thiobacillus sp.]
MTDDRLIKKYPNRRLYDTSESRYITLEEVKKLVMASIPFRVVDSQTEADLTRSILLQIIMEQESGGRPLFTVAMLERFIRFYGDATQAALTSFLDMSLDMFLKQQHAINEHMQGPWTSNPMDFWMKLGQQNMGLWKEMESNFQKAMGANAPKDEKDEA